MTKLAAVRTYFHQVLFRGRYQVTRDPKLEAKVGRATQTDAKKLVDSELHGNSMTKKGKLKVRNARKLENHRSRMARLEPSSAIVLSFMVSMRWLPQR